MSGREDAAPDADSEEPPDDDLPFEEEPPNDLDEARRRERAGWIAEIAAANGPRREAAMEKLFRAYEKRATRWLAWKFRLSFADADDVWQETLVNVCRYAKNFQADQDPWRWIRKIAWNKALDLIKLSSRRHETNTDDGANPADGMAAANDLPREFDLGRCVQRALAHFTQKHPGKLDPLLRLELEGRDIPELTLLMGKPSEEATRSHFTALRKQIRPFIQDCFELLKT